MVMSVVSKSFLRQRAMDSVWPLLIESMCNLSASCQHEAMSNPVYGHTVEYKLQRKLLEVVGELCVGVSRPSHLNNRSR